MNLSNGQEKTRRNPKGSGTTTLAQRHPAWLKLKENILGIGAERFWFELDSLSGKDYIIAWLSVLKFFKPALANQISQDILEIPTIEIVDGLRNLSSNGANGNGSIQKKPKKQ